MNLFKKKMTLIANVFPKLWTRKNIVRLMAKFRRFTVPFNKQDVKEAHSLFKSERRHLCHTDWLLTRLLSLKKCLLVIWKILRIFLNTFTADDKYSVLNRDSLTQPIQSKYLKKNPFSRFFSKVLKCRWNFEHLKKKDHTQS